LIQLFITININFGRKFLYIIGDFDYLRVGDVNKNGKTELYGARKFFQTDYEPVTVYELNDRGIFEPIFQYDSGLYSQKHI
jgi:hypothetical protein